MQTTLLGLAVAIILALVTALVGPLFIDWGRYRSSFEAEASRVVGTPVRVHGPIDARLLPVPSLVLRGVEIGSGGGEARLTARSLRVEFALGPLMRGRWQADELRVDAPEATFGLDDNGRLRLPASAIGFYPDQLSVDRLVIENGRLTMSDAASGGSTTLDKISFAGDLRSLIGPFKGEGAFVSAGEHYGYRIAASRRGEDGGIKLHFTLDPADRPLALAADGTLWLTEAHPRFEGTATLSRPAGLALPDGRTMVSVPWRASGRVKATAAAALIEQIDLQYGPEERAIKLAGTADVRFGATPRVQALLSARQIDVDRAMASAETTRRPPAAMLQAVFEALAPSGRPPIPLRLGVSVDSVVFGGALLQSVQGDVRVDETAVNLDNFEFRAPGATQVRVSGQLTSAVERLAFVGPASIESADPRALVAWLEGRADASAIATASLRVRGDLTIGSERIAAERLHAEFDHRPVRGSLSYSYAVGDRPAVLDAALSADELDVDRAVAFVGNAFAGATFDKPGEMALALDIGKANYAGVEARAAKAKLKLDGRGFSVEKLSIGDLGGAAFEASGRLDTGSPTPQGAITMSINAQRLDAAARLARRFVPQAGDMIEGLATRTAAARLNARIEVGSGNTASPDGKTSARMHVDGALGPVRVDLTATARGDRNAIADAQLELDGHLRSDDAASLARVTGIDRYVTLDRRPARFDFTARGAVGGALRLDGKLAGTALDAAGSGALRLAGGKTEGAFDIAFAAAQARLPGADALAPAPVNLRAHLLVDGDRLTFDNLKGSIAGSPVAGRLGFTLGRPLRVEGRIDADDANAAALIAAIMGVGTSARASPSWSADPFEAPAFADLEGRIAVSAKHAALGAGLMGEQMRGTVAFEPASVVFDNIQGAVANGALTGSLTMRRGSAGLTVEALGTLTNADIGRLLPIRAKGQTSGRVTFQLAARGTGRSPAALVGDLKGGGTLTLEGLQAAGFDPAAIGAAVRAGEQGVAIDTGRIGDIVRTALDRGHLTLPWAAGGFTVADGRIVMDSVTAPAKDANVSATTSLNLNDRTVDLRLTVAGATQADVLGGRPPDIQINLKGPIDQARRSIDVTSLVDWLTLRAVERETKRLEAVERETKRLQAAESARGARVQDAAQDSKREPKPNPGDNRTPATVGPLPSRKPVPPSLPPPIDIKPAPGAFERGPR